MKEQHTILEAFLVMFLGELSVVLGLDKVSMKHSYTYKTQPPYSLDGLARGKHRALDRLIQQ